MNSSEVKQRKLSRLRGGDSPRVLELCSGAGGMSLGFKQAGFDLRAFVEHDAAAVKTFAANFPVDSAAAVPTDLVDDSIQDVLDQFAIRETVDSAFDVVVAGLPCQAFARVGRSKLRSLAGSEDHVYTLDPRAQLYRRFLEIIEETAPLVVVLENVPDILNFGGTNVPSVIGEHLATLGYRTRFTVLNAAHFGVPQYRERLFLVAYAEELGADPVFPRPTHQVEMRRGHRDLRTAAFNKASSSRYFVEPNEPSASDPQAVTTRDALADLPRLSYHLDPNPRRPLVADKVSYSGRPQSAFARSMRYEGGRLLTRTTGHVIRLTPRDFATFALMQHGDEYPRALAIANERFTHAIDRAPHSDAVEREAIFRQIVPPYDAKKFANKWWKLDPKEPSRTLTAHLGRDTYSHIHYDSSQSRMISVREAARLQSFPDWFEFPVSMNSAFTQIGNAVPPGLAFAISSMVSGALRAACQQVSQSAVA